ncbi:hypothetical protein ACJW8F_13180 [Plesiomonas shigelloides]|uniref:hypothetical protein n=1 Tax=Plesiomonas shigelloides TaxID=703 RepID=UPI00387F32E0
MAELKGSDIANILIDMSQDKPVQLQQLEQVETVVANIKAQYKQATLSKVKTQLKETAELLGVSLEELAAQLGVIPKTEQPEQTRGSYKKYYVDFGTPERPQLHKLNQRKATFDADDELRAYCVKQQLFNPKTDEWSYKVIKQKLEDKGLIIAK